MDTLKDKSCQELHVNVLLADSTNFQHTSLLKCSLKLKLHHLKAYEPLYGRSLMVKANPASLDEPPCLGDGVRLTSKTTEPQLYLSEIKMTVIIRFSIVIPVLADSLPCCTPAPAQVRTSNFSAQMTDAFTP